MDIHPLEQAMIDASEAFDGNGLRVMLVPNPFDMASVKRALAHFFRAFEEGNVFLGPQGEENAARNLSLIANLYYEHLKHRRENPTELAIMAAEGD